MCSRDAVWLHICSIILLLYIPQILLTKLKRGKTSFQLCDFGYTSAKPYCQRHPRSVSHVMSRCDGQPTRPPPHPCRHPLTHEMTSACNVTNNIIIIFLLL